MASCRNPDDGNPRATYQRSIAPRRKLNLEFNLETEITVNDREVTIHIGSMSRFTCKQRPLAPSGGLLCAGGMTAFRYGPIVA